MIPPSTFPLSLPIKDFYHLPWIQPELTNVIELKHDNTAGNLKVVRLTKALNRPRVSISSCWTIKKLAQYIKALVLKVTQSDFVSSSMGWVWGIGFEKEKKEGWSGNCYSRYWGLDIFISKGREDFKKNDQPLIYLISSDLPRTCWSGEAELCGCYWIHFKTSQSAPNDSRNWKKMLYNRAGVFVDITSTS